VATYTEAGADFPMPELSADWSALHVTAPAPDHHLGDDDTAMVELAVQQLVEPWTTSSDGHVDIIGVHGGVAEALGALGLRRASISRLDPADALAWLAWAGASGGSHGRRRGAAAGRFGAWWLLAALGDLIDDWPVPPDELGDLAEELLWYRWNAAEPEVGRNLRLAIVDPADGITWAIAATDS
jgi:hypothetical protein